MSEQQTPEQQTPKQAESRKWAIAIGHATKNFYVGLGLPPNTPVNIDVLLQSVLTGTVSVIMNNQKFPMHLHTQTVEWATEALITSLHEATNVVNEKPEAKLSAVTVSFMGLFCSREFTWNEEPAIQVVGG